MWTSLNLTSLGGEWLKTIISVCSSLPIETGYEECISAFSDLFVVIVIVNTWNEV